MVFDANLKYFLMNLISKGLTIWFTVRYLCFDNQVSTAIVGHGLIGWGCTPPAPAPTARKKTLNSPKPFLRHPPGWVVFCNFLAKSHLCVLNIPPPYQKTFYIRSGSKKQFSTAEGNLKFFGYPWYTPLSAPNPVPNYEFSVSI